MLEQKKGSIPFSVHVTFQIRFKIKTERNFIQEVYEHTGGGEVGGWFVNKTNHC